VATDIVARFDHNWKVVGMSRAIDACPGLKYSELLREELRYQLGSLDVFGRVPLEEIPEPRTVYRAAARIDARAIDPEPQPEPLFPADVRGMGLARAVNGKALNEIIGLCGVCVNRRNMAIGLGDGRFSYDRERERLHMSVKFAFDVSRAARGVMLDFGRELDPEYRPGGPVRRRQLR